MGVSESLPAGFRGDASLVNVPNVLLIVSGNPAEI